MRGAAPSGPPGGLRRLGRLVAPPVASLFFRLLARLGVRVMILVGRDVDGEGGGGSPPGSDEGDAFEVGVLEPGEVADRSVIKPGTDPEDLRDRWSRGHTCLVARVEGRIVHAGWLGVERVPEPFLGCDVVLGSEEGWIYDTYTVPDDRGRGAASARARALLGHAGRLGLRRLWGAVFPGNAPALAMARKHGYRPRGVLVSIRIGRRRRCVRWPRTEGLLLAPSVGRARVRTWGRGRGPAAFDWEALAEEWSHDSPHALWRRHRDAVTAGILDRWLPAAPARRTLKTDLFDEAFGRGVFGRLQADSGHLIVGIDVSTSVVKAARGPPERPVRAALLRADVRTLPFEANSFELVLSPSTLDHFDSVGELIEGLRELIRVLGPGGVLIVTLDNPSNPVVALRNLLPFRLLHAVGLVPYYVGATCGVRRLEHVLRTAGLRVGERDALVHCPRVVAVHLGRLLERLPASRLQRVYLRGLMAFEHLGRLPSRFLTGHYVAVRAVKPAEGARREGERTA